MVKVTVRYIGPLSNIINRKEEEVVFNLRVTVQDLINYLIKKHGMKLQKLLYSKAGQFNEYIVILINGKFLESLETSIENEDVVTISPMVTGG